MAVSYFSINAILVQDEDKIQHPVYYISKKLLDLETRYPNIEKLALALVVASRKLRPYSTLILFWTTNYPPKNVLQKLDTIGRLFKWAIELGQFKIDYRPRISLKGHALTNFIAEFSYQVEVHDVP